MKKYRLKDKGLQKKLDALSDVHQFSGCLQKACKRQFRDHFDYVRVEFGRIAMLDGRSNEFTHVFFIPKSDIEEYEGYNPKTWNKFPEVEPPEDVWMRCVMTDIHHNNRIVRVGANFSTGAWRDHEGVAFEPRFRVDKFKFWDEEDGQ